MKEIGQKLPLDIATCLIHSAFRILSVFLTLIALDMDTVRRQLAHVEAKVEGSNT